MRIAIDWTPSTLHGWGVYALNLALAFAGDPSVEFYMPYGECLIDPLRAAMLPKVEWQPNEADVFLHALGNQVLPEPATPYEKTIGVIFYEERLTGEAVKRAEKYPAIICGSEYNAVNLFAHGRQEVIYQGVDRSLFHPATRILKRNAYRIFSGGKAEWRKGQDLVLQAFKVFSDRHADAILVTAWHSPWPQLSQSLKVPLKKDGSIDPVTWAASYGIDPKKVIDLGMMHNTMMPPIYREMDCAIFPNRIEGGTNLVAMECMACGVPTFVSANTGHLDLPRETHIAQASYGEMGAGETDIEALVEAMEDQYNRLDPPVQLHGFEWRTTANEIKKVCRDVARL